MGTLARVVWTVRSVDFLPRSSGLEKVPDFVRGTITGEGFRSICAKTGVLAVVMEILVAGTGELAICGTAAETRLVVAMEMGLGATVLGSVTVETEAP